MQTAGLSSRHVSRRILEGRRVCFSSCLELACERKAASVELL